MTGDAGTDALDDLADEVVGALVDALDRVAELRRQRRVVERMLRIDQPPHHVLHAIGGLDHADQQVPVLGVDALQDHLGAIVEGDHQVVHERLLVHAVFVQRPGRFGPPQRPVVADRL